MLSMLRKKIESQVIQNGTPLTELSNKLSKNIDLCKNGEEILKILAQTDAEIFNGCEIFDLKSDGLKTDCLILKKISDLSDLITEGIRNQSIEGRFKIILSGCGTSGRLGYLCAQTFSQHLKSKYSNLDYELCDYIIAGDDYALVNSVESVEDKPKIGAENLEKIIDEHPNTRCVFIGITCGLSAPFVAGQIDLCLNKRPENFIACCLIGFNPVEMTRKTHPVNELYENFYDLMQKMVGLENENPKKFFILNPLIGPEPITGSSRMKSGTTTKILIDLIFVKSLCSLENNENSNQPEMLDFYEKILGVLYSKETMKNLGNLIDLSAESLRNLKNGGSINYLSDSERLGLLCCVDASECLPTYGAGKKDIKGYVSVTDGISLTQKWNGFVKNCTSTWSQNILNNLNKFNSDKCVFILIEDDDDPQTDDKIHVKKVLEKVLIENTSCLIYKINLSSRKIHPNDRVNVINFDGLDQILDQATKTYGNYFSKCLQEFILKLVINSISTGAHVLYGKTYENIMIDVKVSNIKLYWRAVGILKKFCPNLNQDECEDFLLNSIYGGKEMTNNKHDIQSHIEVSSTQELVVPKALVMAMTKCNYSQASDLLNESRNSVRNCIFKIKSQLN